MKDASRLRKKYELVLGTQTKNKRSDCGGNYCHIMAEAILAWKPKKNGFTKALAFFLEKRKEILRDDIKAAFLSPKKIQHGPLWSLDYHLRLLNQNSTVRLAGVDSKKFYTPITDHLIYKKLFHYLTQKDFNKRWSPQGDSQLKLSHAPLLITRAKGPSFRLHHAWSEDIPIVLDHLGHLWNRTLQAKTRQESLISIAHFEWWFFNANPTGRSAAALGDCLSLILQMKQKIPLRKKFIRLDLYALGRELDEYTRWRIKNSQSHL